MELKSGMVMQFTSWTMDVNSYGQMKVEPNQILNKTLGVLFKNKIRLIHNCRKNIIFFCHVQLLVTQTKLNQTKCC